MPMKPDDALTAVRQIMAGPRTFEKDRLDKIATALSPVPQEPTVEMPNNPLPVMRNLGLKSRTNLLTLVLDTFSQGIIADGYSSADKPGNGKAWEYWQRNGMDARQTGITRSALAFGASYATVLPGDNGPAIRGCSPRQMTAVYQDPTEDEYPMLALRVDHSMIRLYDEQAVYFIGIENLPRSGLGEPYGYWNAVDFTFLESRSHGVGVCPVVRFRDRMLLQGEEQYGIIEPLLPIQSRIDETVFGMLIAQYYAAFKQRYIIGWVPQSEKEALETSAATVWTFDDDTVKVGELSETDLTRYITSKESAVADMAAVAQLSPQSLGAPGGVHNIAADALAALQSGKDQKTGEISISLGESYEQMLRLAALVDGDTVAAEDFSSQIRWKQTSARSLAQTVDAMVKAVSTLGVNEKMAREWLPGWTDEMEANNERLGPPLAAQAAAASLASAGAGLDPMAQLLATLDRQSQSATTATTTDAVPPAA